MGVNEQFIGLLAKVGVLEKHREAPLYLPFNRNEVERLNAHMIVTAEIVRNGRFSTYRKASAWLRQQGVAPRFELKKGGWKVYARAEVEAKLARRIDAMPPKPAPPPMPTGPRYAPDSTLGKLAAARESSDASRIGLATAARILGSTIYSVQKLAAKGHLTASHKVTPFDLTEVEALAKQIVFVPEITRLSGYISHVAVMNWLRNAGIEPLFWLEIGRLPVFDRNDVEAHIVRSGFIRGEHPRLVRQKLLFMVQRGSSVRQASIACGVSYATAKRWVKSDAVSNYVRSGRGDRPRFIRRMLLDMVERGNSLRQASIACGVNYETAKAWARVDLTT
jgi:molybdenum-dependent DNA-binding transcriptional regulator ModE